MNSFLCTAKPYFWIAFPGVGANDAETIGK